MTIGCKKLLDYLSVGYVLKPQGLKGEIKVEPLTDYAERFDELDTLYLKTGKQYSQLKIVSARYMGDFAYLRFAGIHGIDEAEELRGQYLWIPRNMARILPDDACFIADIIGCEVCTQEGQVLGQVESIISTGSNDVYVIHGSKGEILIPGLKKVVLKVDTLGKKIIVSAQELGGLLPNEN